DHYCRGHDQHSNPSLTCCKVPNDLHKETSNLWLSRRQWYPAAFRVIQGSRFLETLSHEGGLRAGRSRRHEDRQVAATAWGWVSTWHQKSRHDPADRHAP